VDRPDTDEEVDLPGFNVDLRNQIQAGIVEAVRRDVKISNNDWETLRRALVEYVLDAEYWRGFPTAEKLKPVKAVRREATELLKALAAARASDVSYFVEMPAETEALLNAQLLGLARLNLNSPRVSQNSDQPKWHDSSRQILLGRIERWWRSMAGAKYAPVKFDATTPFHRFLKQAYSAIPPGFEPGDSYAAVKRLRAERNKLNRELEKLGRLLDEKISRR